MEHGKLHVQSEVHLLKEAICPRLRLSSSCLLGMAMTGKPWKLKLRHSHIDSPELLMLDYQDRGERNKILYHLRYHIWPVSGLQYSLCSIQYRDSNVRLHLIYFYIYFCI